jgi:NTP pyrophosphatase (non-canonical NTP hydrolase)
VSFKIKPTNLYYNERGQPTEGEESFDQAFNRITRDNWDQVKTRRAETGALHVLEHQDHGDGDSYLLSNGLTLNLNCDCQRISCGVGFAFYQHHAKKTAKYPGFADNIGSMEASDPQAALTRKKSALSYLALGLVGESGEYAEKIKKLIRGDVQPDNAHTLRAFELGDVLWYLSMLAMEDGASLTWVALNNLEKLADRHTRGVTLGSGDTR